MSNKRYIVGAKPTTKMRVIIGSIFSVVLGISLGIILENLIDFNFIAGSIMGSCAFIFLCVPSVSTINEHWDLTDEYFEYRYFHNHIEQAKYALDILMDKEDRVVARIKLSEIENIKLYWSIAFSVYSIMYFPLRMEITLKDSSILDTEAFLNKKEDFYEAFDYLKSKGIKIEDKYNLLNAIRDPELNINDYIMTIRDRKKHDKV